ncbi:HNH endonuclease [Brevundimonas bullata]
MEAAVAPSPPARTARQERNRRYYELRSQGVSAKSWGVIRRAVIKRDGYRCRYCGVSVTVPQIDHIMPLSRGGSSRLKNLCVACKPCNSSKRDMTASEWGGVQ